MIRTIGMLEFNSIAKGIETADNMLKAAEVELVFSKAVCPGKFIVLVSGDVGSVKSSVESGIAWGGQYVVDSLILPNVHHQLIPAINGFTQVEGVNAVGVLEFFSIATCIKAADAAAKAAQIQLIELRLGVGIGGKAFVTLAGDVSAVNEAVEAGANKAIETGMLVNKVVIPSPREEVFRSLL